MKISKNLLFPSIVALAISVVTENPAVAGYMFAFDQANYQVEPGATVDVGVSLVQDGNDSILTDEGLMSAGVRVFFNDAPVPSDPAAVLSTADISPNVGVFDDLLLPPTTVLDPGMSAGISETVDLFSPPASGDSIFLGTFRFTAGTIGGEVTTLRATIFDPAFATTISAFSFTVLDGQISDGVSQITVNASTPTPVPEPSSLVLFAVGGIALCGVARQRRRYGDSSNTPIAGS